MYFFFPQNIIKVVPIIVGNLYEKLSRKKSVIKLSFYKFYSSISCRHIACNFTDTKLLFLHLFFETLCNFQNLFWQLLFVQQNMQGTE